MISLVVRLVTPTWSVNPVETGASPPTESVHETVSVPPDSTPVAGDTVTPPTLRSGRAGATATVYEPTSRGCGPSSTAPPASGCTRSLYVPSGRVADRLRSTELV